MNIVQLTSESIRDLREKRASIVQHMIDDQDGSLLVLGTAYAGENRQHHLVSYAIFMIFFELWERFDFETWSYTFDQEGLIFYIKLKQEGNEVKDTLVHYEDHHPLGFAIDSEVYSKDKAWTRTALEYEERVETFTNQPLEQILGDVIEDKRYSDHFMKEIEGFIVKGDKQTILSNILVYGYVSAFAKEYGFGMYGPNFKGSNDQMNFEKFIYLVRAYKQEMKRIFSVNSHNFSDIRNFQNEVDQAIKYSVLNQQSYLYTVFMTSVTLFGFINSRGYADIMKQIKKLGESLKDRDDDLLKVDGSRYDIVYSGFREVFNQYVPFLQKNKSIVSTLLFIMSRHDDQSILIHNGEQNLLKTQFLAKNLIMKPDKWEQLDKFCLSSYIYPHDSTTLLAITCMLDLMQRYYLKIKMLFDASQH